MNRERITQGAKDFLLEYKGDAGAESPHVWPFLVTQACNDVARKTGSYYGATVLPIATGVSDYPVKSVYAIRRVTCSDGSGNVVRLDPIAMDDLNRWGPTLGFTTATGAYAVGVPSMFVRLASNSIRLLAVPNYPAANGLTIEGLAYPGESWPMDVDECPLPVEAHMAVMYRAACLRYAQFANADNKASVDALAAVYETEIASAKEMIGATIQVQDQMDVSAAFTGGV